jgi:hypothetical protein
MNIIQEGHLINRRNKYTKIKKIRKFREPRMKTLSFKINKLILVKCFKTTEIRVLSSPFNPQVLKIRILIMSFNN